MSLKIYDTATQKQVSFEPVEPGHVKMYVCGPTVYGLLHIGNFRGPIFFNLVRNWLEQGLGYKVTYVYNYTDVDDKIISRANEEGLSAQEVAERFIAEFEKDFKKLQLRPHDHNPKVTEHMPGIVAMVQALVEKEQAYVKAGEVLFSVRKFQSYGKLSHKKVDDLESGSRIDIDQKKQDPLDFALWKPAKPGEPAWPSPWGEGRPGWHIECSAMIKKILGDTIDIHGGGMDLIFPHHENEIAQSEAANGHPFVKYWMHNNMLNFGDRKMSKSVGNIIRGRDFMEQYDAEILKFMMLSVHYRSPSDFSDKQISNAISGLARVYSSLALVDEVLSAGVVAATQPSAAFVKALSEQTQKWTDSLNDDFNTPEAFAALYTLIRFFNASYRHGQKVTPEIAAGAQAFARWIRQRGEWMALFQEPAASYLRQLDDRLLTEMNVSRATIDGLVAERTQARTNKDFARGDELRKQLTEMKILLHDTPTGTSWEVAK